MPDKIVLTYFNAQGRAELARLIMAQGEIEYEDRRITHEQWAEIKQNTPLGQLPLLEVNGTKISQSLAIAHFLAKRANLCGKNEVEAAKAEMIIQTLNDIINKAIPAMTEKDEAIKTKMMETFEGEFLPPIVQKLAAILSDNGGKFVVGNQLTWADLCLADFFSPRGICQYLTKFELSTAAPGLVDHSKTVLEMPKIKAWIEKRPKTSS